MAASETKRRDEPRPSPRRMRRPRPSRRRAGPGDGPSEDPPRISHAPAAIAVTGGIGAGKSEALHAFARRGIPTLSSDEVVHG